MDQPTETSRESSPVPPVIPTHLVPLIASRPPPQLTASVSLKEFVNLTGGSLFYCLSALSIIYGITQIMGPLLLKPNVLNETLPCIGALNLYELALLGILVFIVAWRKVTDDAISLVLLIPLFLIGSGIALDTVATNGPVLAIGIGAVCAAVGCGKLAVLKQVIRVPVGRIALAGLMLVVTWNSLIGPLLVKLFADHHGLLADKRSLWLGSLLLLTISCSLTLVEMIRSPEPVIDQPTPFLRAPPMVSVFALVLLGAAGAHLYALGFQFDIPFGNGDFMLLTTLGVILLVETIHYFGDNLRELTVMVGCVPLIGTAIVLGDGGFSVPFQWGLELQGHPSTVLAAGGLGMMRLALKTRWAPYFWVTGIYGLAVVLTGFSPPVPAEFNWRLCGGLIVLALFASGVVMKRPSLCVAAVTLITLGLGTSIRFTHAVEAIGLSAIGGMAGCFGLGILAVAVVAKNKTLVPLAVLGAAALAGAALDLMTNTIGWRDAVTLCILATLAVLVWRRLQSSVAVGILGIPVLIRLWMLFRNLSTWRYVVLSFLLLGIGTWISIAKSRQMNAKGTTGG